MKVWYIMMSFPARSETFAILDVAALRDLSIDVSVFCLRGHALQESEIEQLLGSYGLTGLPLSHSSIGSVLRGLSGMVLHPITALLVLHWIVRSSWRMPVHVIKAIALLPRSFTVWAEIRKKEPEVVHLFWGHYPSVLGYLVAQRPRRTVLSIFLGAYDLDQRFAGSGWVAHRADAVWTHAWENSPAIATLGQLSSGQVRVVHRGIDSTRFSIDSSPSDESIVCVSRLIVTKGVDDVLRTFARVSAERPTATLAVLGDGPDRPRLEQLSRSLGVDRRVTFLGYCTPERVAEQLTRAAVFLFMSRKPGERLPNAVKEAMASGCPCVVSHTPGIDELIAHEQNGFIVPPGDVDVAARYVLQLLQTPQLHREIAEEARATIVQDFDVRVSMSQYVAEWRRLISNAGATLVPTED